MNADQSGSPAPSSAWAVFVDFDGTITDLDTFDVLVKRFAGGDAWAITEVGLIDGTTPLRDVLQKQASHVRGSFEDVAALLRREIAVDPAFAPFARVCRANDVPVTVVSSGIAPIIRGRLAEIGLGDVPVVANDVEITDAGWSIRFRDSVGNGTDKAAVVREAKARGRRTVFVGDGISDFAAALEADRRFAKRGRALERHLAENGEPYEPFTSFAEIERALFAGATTRDIA